MTPQESALLDRSLPIYNSPLPLGFWVQIAALHLERPVSLNEFRAWRDDYVARHPQLIADALEYLERQG